MSPAKVGLTGWLVVLAVDVFLLVLVGGWVAGVLGLMLVVGMLGVGHAAGELTRERQG